MGLAPATKKTLFTSDSFCMFASYISRISAKKIINTLQRIEFCLGQRVVHRMLFETRNECDSVVNSRDMATEGSKTEC
jgi:hypothetical protein